MSYIVTVHRRTPAPATTAERAASNARDFTEFKCFEQEIEDADFNMSKFVLSLNKPKRVRKAKVPVAAR